VRLVQDYFQSLSEADQRRTIRAISDFVAAELPFLPLFYEADHIGARKGVKALDDVAGGAGAGAPYGYYSRNAHLWEIQ
jgi:hypothetical protein